MKEPMVRLSLRVTHVGARRSYSASSTRETSSTLLNTKNPVNTNITHLNI